MMEINVISTGSGGNSVFLPDIGILIDCGVPFKSLSGIIKDVKLVLLTHIHGDHFKKTTIKKIAQQRPSVRFAAGAHLYGAMSEILPKSQIDILESGKIYSYGDFSVSPFDLVHDVPNFGWKIFHGEEKAIYATDTNTMTGISAVRYDVYMIEANHGEHEIMERAKEKIASGEFAYEIRAKKTHLSKEKATEWLVDNAGENSIVYWMHRSEGWKNE